MYTYTYISGIKISQYQKRHDEERDCGLGGIIKKVLLRGRMLKGQETTETAASKSHQ